MALDAPPIGQSDGPHHPTSAYHPFNPDECFRRRIDNRMEFGQQADEVSTRVIVDEAEWDSIRNQWDELYAASSYASPPLHFDWLRNWWRLYGAAYGAGGLRIVTVWRGVKCVGAIPLYLGRRTVGPVGIRELRLISTGEAEHEEICPDYLNLLCLPGDEAICNESVWREIAHMPWDYLEFLNLPERSPLLGSHSADLTPSRTEVVRQGVCPVADLGRGFEAYIECLSPKGRRNARKYLRVFDREGAVFELASASTADRFIDDLIRLHQEWWTTGGKQPGCFAAARFTEFHRRLANDWVPAGRAVLARLSHGGTVYSVLYGFGTRTKFYFYQSGVSRNETGPFESPGITAYLLLIRALVERGFTEYDFHARAVRL